MSLVSVVIAADLQPSDVALLSLHLVATAATFGEIRFVQVVHHPRFGSVESDSFAVFERAHRRRTSFIVGPLMAAEALTAGWLLVDPPTSVALAFPVAGLVLLGVIHTSAG